MKDAPMAPTALQDLRPGAKVAQDPKPVSEVRLCSDAVTVVFEDGSTFSGSPTDAVMVVSD